MRLEGERRGQGGGWSEKEITRRGKETETDREIDREVEVLEVGGVVGGGGEEDGEAEGGGDGEYEGGGEEEGVKE